MNKFFRKAIVLALAGSALLYVGCTKDYSGEITTLQKELEDLKKSTSEQFTSLNNQIGNMQQQLSSLETAKERIEKNIQTLTDRVGALETFRNSAEQKFSQYDQKFTELDGEIAGLKANIAALQNADVEIQKAIDAVKARIKALEDNTYNKTEVDNKLEALKNWATESFATKEDLSQVEYALGILAGTVEGIDTRLEAVEATLSGIVDTEIPAIKQSIEDLRTELAGVKQIAETAAANASQALGEIADLREQLKNYYTIAEVDALLKTMKDAIDAEIDALKNSDVKLNERIDSLAGVTKKIEDDFAAFVTATNEKLADLEAKLDNEIALRLADSAANVAAHKELDEYIKAVETAYQLADEQLNARCDALNERCALIEGRVSTLEGQVATLRDEMDQAKQDIIANATEIANVKTDIANKYAEVVARFDEDEKALAELTITVLALYFDVTKLQSVAERIQSVVFVPEYNDLKASMVKVFVDGEECIQNIVRATFEVQPNSALVYIDSLVKTNSIGLAVKEVASRTVDVDHVVYDVDVILSENGNGRFEMIAFLGPDIDEDIVVSCVLGDFEVGVFNSGNAIQSSFVGVANEEEDINIRSNNFLWFDTELKEPAGTLTDEGDSLGVNVRVAYTDPAEDSLVFKAVSENLDIYMNIGTAATPNYKTIAEVEKLLHLPAGLLAPVGSVTKFQTKDAQGHIVNSNEPFEFADEAYAPETSLTTAVTDEGIVNPMFVGYNNVRKEGFKVLDMVIDPYAFVGTVITKHQVPEFTVDPAYEIPWSYVHYEWVPLQSGKSFAVDGNTDFGKAINGSYDNSDENFTKNDQAYTPEAEWINFIPADADASAMVRFFGWVFEKEDVNYVAKTERFETESDEYTINVPFKVKARAADRKVIIPMGTVDYTPTYGLSTLIQDNTSNALPGAIAPAFRGDEDLFIGDAAEFAPGYDCVDSLYSAYANQGSAYHCFSQQVLGSPITESFVVDSVRVNGVLDENAIEYISVDLRYDGNNSQDESTLSILPGYLPYGAEITVYGRYNQFYVNFYYEISFSTPGCPFYLVLTPYGDFDPAKSKTIIVEGDDHYDAEGNPTSDDDARRYNIQQMYYTKYMRVQDQEGVPTNLGEDLEVRLLFEYEDFAEFGIEITPDSTPDEIQAAEQMRGTFSGVTDVVDVLSDDLAGYLDQQAILKWGTYQGRKVKVYATLYDNDVCVSEALEFYIETMKPIELVQPLYIGSETDPLIRISGDPVDIKPASAMIVGGILSRDADYKPYYVADPSVFGYNDNNVRQEGIRVNEGSWFNPRYVYYPAGQFHPFYGPLDNNGEGRIVSELIFDYDNIHAILNEKEWDLKNGGDWTVIFDDYGETFRLIKDSGKGNIILNIPVKFRYYLDYCGAKAQEGIVTVYIKQI